MLADMLGEEYDILEAEDGVRALAILQKYGTEIDLVLLDIVMPHVNGFDVLSAMKKNGWIEDIPVIMITSETASAHVERAYNLGCTDFINRPFDALVVHRRVMNTILLYAKQKKLIGLLGEQLIEKERNNNMMIDILSHIVEFRNGESGLHVLHVRTITEMLLRTLAEKTDKFYVYKGTRGDKTPIRIVDKKGFIKVQCSNGFVEKCPVSKYQEVVEQLWKDGAVFKTDTVLRPDFFVCVGPRVGDYSAVDLEQIFLLMDLDLGDREPDEEIIIVGAVTEI